MNAEIGIMYDICRTQADIYKYAAEHKYNMEEFSPAYLKSDFCRRAMDSEYSRFQLEAPNECFDFITPEIGTFVSDTYFNEDVAEWIGWIYRFLCFHIKMSSSELVDKVSFNTMCRYYPGLHTIDEYMAIDIISENFNLPKSEQKIERKSLFDAVKT